MSKFTELDPPVSISGKVPESLHTAMQKFMDDTGISKSELLRRAIVQFLRSVTHGTP